MSEQLNKLADTRIATTELWPTIMVLAVYDAVVNDILQSPIKP
jgi:hypothetical protein